MSAKRRQRRKRSPRLLRLLVMLAALVLFYQYSNYSLQTERVEFFSPHLPQEFDGFRIVQLSDLHSTQFGEGNERLLRRVREEQPELIVVTGDLVDRWRGMEEAALCEFASALSAIAPCYFVTGNHEWALGGVPQLKELLRENGVTPLSNEYTTLTRDGASIILAGIDDPNGYADQKTPEELAAELTAAEGDVFWLLLAHRNDRFAEQYSLLGADLTFSGHGHGGIIRLPFTDGLISTRRTLFPTHTDGFYEDHGATVFVSRGLGNSGISRRLLNRPQIAVVTLRCAEEN